MGSSYPFLKVLSEEDMQEIHEKSIFLLEKVGFKIASQKALEILADHGVKVDLEKQMAFMHRSLVEECLKKAPKSFTLGSLDDHLKVVLPHPEGGFYTRSATGAQGILDMDNNHRYVKQEDVKNWVKVIDALDELDICSVPTPSDVPANARDIYALKCALENTQKHIMVQPYSEKGLEHLATMAVMVAGGKDSFKENPNISMACCVTPPLSIKFMDVEIIFLAEKYGIPLHICSLISPGGTCPVTPAGSILMSNAELLATITLAQIISPGISVIGVTQKLPLDMASGIALQCPPEAILANAAGVQIIKELYGIPTRTYGLGTDSLFVDFQSAAERVLKGSLITLVGTDILSTLGNLESTTSISLPQLVLDNEIITMLKKLKRGVLVNKEELAVEVMVDVADKGNFLQHKHTFKHCRDSWRPELFYWGSRDSWQRQGGKGALDKAREKVENILRKHETPAISDSVQKDLDRLVQEANLQP